MRVERKSVTRRSLSIERHVCVYVYMWGVIESVLVWRERAYRERYTVTLLVYFSFFFFSIM